MSTTYEAIWAFREDLQAMKENFREEFEAHTSQPLGTPLRKYEGQLSIDDEGVSLIGKSKDAQEEFSLFVPFKGVLDVYLGWDDVLSRWKDTRALIKPLRIKFKGPKTKRPRLLWILVILLLRVLGLRLVSQGQYAVDKCE